MITDLDQLAWESHASVHRSKFNPNCVTLLCYLPCYFSCLILVPTVCLNLGNNKTYLEKVSEDEMRAQITISRYKSHNVKCFV